MRISHTMRILRIIREICVSQNVGLKLFENVSLKINGKHSIKWKENMVQLNLKFIYFYADFQSVLKGIKSNDWNKNTSLLKI